MRVVTFDFDDTLLQSRALFDEDGDYDSKEYLPDPNPDIAPALEEELSRPDTHVYIVTSRTPGNRNYDSPWPPDRDGKPPTLERDLNEWLRVWREQIPAIRRLKGVRFTSGALKRDTLAELGAVLHYDDDPEELANLPPGCEGVQAFPHPSWRPKEIDNTQEGSIMRITESQLRRIISRELNEMGMNPHSAAHGAHSGGRMPEMRNAKQSVYYLIDETGGVTEGEIMDALRDQFGPKQIRVAIMSLMASGDIDRDSDDAYRITDY